MNVNLTRTIELRINSITLLPFTEESEVVKDLEEKMEVFFFFPFFLNISFLYFRWLNRLE